MSLKKEDTPTLILIDIQQAFDDEEYWGGTRNNTEAEENAKRLLDYWRAHGLPLFHIQHISKNPDAKHGLNSPGHFFKEIVKPMPGEIIIQKSVNSSFIGTDLKEQLDKKGLNTLVIVGLTTDHCVSTTTRMAGNYGYETYLVSDATATFGKKGIHGEYYDGEMMHRTALAQLNEEFAAILSTQNVIDTLDVL
ncbi:Nicotinamidase-related amidase [Mucilaginibacter mallensis]|uniref:Nicotinamidase-related amidase n=1 Tax=Mucilaginibacter mallensis TaxID=652787 RepID=A0A1H2CEC8_MUCMA|nr:cysteine hydrolase family protein [Mucilaginibacter mallensis]SDT68793.1 Nicotinamidase-related amidase [Mucilaginibacter mallensis]